MNAAFGARLAAPPDERFEADFAELPPVRLAAVLAPPFFAAAFFAGAFLAGAFLAALAGAFLAVFFGAGPRARRSAC